MTMIWHPPWVFQSFVGSDKADEEDEDYDDTKDHEVCEDCRGSGWYVGLVERRHCPSCDGSGYV